MKKTRGEAPGVPAVGLYHAVVARAPNPEWLAARCQYCGTLMVGQLDLGRGTITLTQPCQHFDGWHAGASGVRFAQFRGFA